MVIVRTCRNCGTAFSPPRCSTCRKETMRKYRAANKKQRSDYLKKWRSENPAKFMQERGFLL